MFLRSYGYPSGCTRRGRAPTPADMSYLHSVSLSLESKGHLLGKEITKSSALQYNFRSDCLVYPLPEAGQTVCRLNGFILARVSCQENATRADEAAQGTRAARQKPPLKPGSENDAACGLRDQPEQPLAGRKGLWMAEADWPIRQVKLRGLHKVDWMFVFSCAAHNLCRMPRLMAQNAV